MNNSINAPRLTSALQLIEQAAAVLVAVSLSAEEVTSLIDIGLIDVESAK